MQLIRQGHTIIDRTQFPTPHKFIEHIGRLCYQSHDKITATSAGHFVSNLIARGHYSVFEHATAVFACNDFRNLKEFRGVTLQDMKYLNFTIRSNSHSNHCMLSGSLRAFAEVFEKHPQLIDGGIYEKLSGMCRQLFPSSTTNRSKIAFAVMAHPFAIYNFDQENAMHHIYISIRFITNRGVSHELVRHRPCAISQESTRYVRYDGKDMLFIEPVWFYNPPGAAEGNYVDWLNRQYTFNDTKTPEFVFLESCAIAERNYLALLTQGWQPQQAREVLPSALKTELVITANLHQWHHMLRLRCAKNAHPQMRALMQPVLRDFLTMNQNLYRVFFNDLEYLTEE